MIEKGEIIELALINVGNITDYNDNRSQIYQIANNLLNGIVSSVCKSNEFNFPSTTVRLTVSTKSSSTGEYVYNIPEGFLGLKKHPIHNTKTPFRVESIKELVNGNRGSNFRLEGEYIYSYEHPLIINYVRDIPLSEFPEYMKDYLIILLALKLSQSIPMYADRLMYLENKIKQEKINITLTEGNVFPLNLKGGINGKR